MLVGTFCAFQESTSSYHQSDHSNNSDNTQKGNHERHHGTRKFTKPLATCLRQQRQHTTPKARSIKPQIPLGVTTPSQRVLHTLHHFVHPSYARSILLFIKLNRSMLCLLFSRPLLVTYVWLRWPALAAFHHMLRSIPLTLFLSTSAFHLSCSPHPRYVFLLFQFHSCPSLRFEAFRPAHCKVRPLLLALPFSILRTRLLCVAQCAACLLCASALDSVNVNASTRELIWSTTLDGRGPVNTWQEEAATRICVTVSREHQLRRAGACGRPNLGWWLQHSKKKLLCSKRLRIHVLMRPVHHPQKKKLLTHRISSPTRFPSLLFRSVESAI